MKKLVSLMMVVMLLAVAVVPFSLSASAEATTFNVTHFNNSDVEGACVIFTTAYSGCTWWAHVAFAPVEGKENTYEIVEILNGLGDGSGAPLTIPEGGFVYGVNGGNNWADLAQAAIDAGNLESQWWYSAYQADQEYYTTNFQNAATQAMITALGSWAVGDMFVFEGLNLDTLEVPTSTPDINWYDEGYTSTATYAPATNSDILPPESTPADESDPADESTPADESVPANESVPADTSASDDVSKGDNEGGSNTWIYIAVAVVVVAVVAVVVVVVAKKKK
ncbi:MAG: hypothetical protein J6A85_00575 [Clostridia bacterium]|nr:hypothetical protein [Clostridia bacterium]